MFAFPAFRTWNFIMVLTMLIFLFVGIPNTRAAAPTISSQPTSVSVYSGEDASFTVATNDAETTCGWYRGYTTTNPISYEKTLTISSARLADAGSFYFKATNTDGSTTSTRVTLSVTSVNARNPKAKMTQAGFSVGGGTILKFIRAGTITVADGKTSKTLTLTGVKPNDLVLLTPQADTGAVRWSAVALTERITVTTTSAVSGAKSFSYLVVGP